MKYKNGEEFLNNLYSNMHMEDVVMHHTEKSDTPTEKIGKYLNRLERVHDKAKDSKHKMDILKSFYYDKYVIKELPESYINLQRKIARERGYGDITVTDKMKEEWLLQIQNEQKISLNIWLDYLTSDDAMYPMWFKHYAFRGMLKLNKFNKEKKEFGKRSKSTVEPYVELNREALARVYNSLVKEIGSNEEISEDASKALENGESFKKLYEYYLMKTEHVTRDKNTDGIWIKYEQGSDYRPLWKSLQGKNTGWCTAGENMAKIQLSSGDFYVYYTKDENGEYKEPRVAIRMDGKFEIGEVRGVDANQNLEDCMTGVVEEKLNEFSDKDAYLKKVNDMKLLTEIDNKVNNNIELTKEELRFLYEVDSEIEGFGYEKDPRIREIIDKRNQSEDYSVIFNVPVENIGLSEEDLYKKDVVCFAGNLKYDGEVVPNNLKHIKYIVGSVCFNNLTSAEGLENLQYIGGFAEFNNLTSAVGLDSLQSIGGFAEFSNLTSAVGLESLQYIGGAAYFNRLTSAKGLDSLQSIGGYAQLKKLTSAVGLESLQYIGGDAFFHRLTSAKGLDSLQSIGERAVFENLISAAGLESLQNIGGDAYFNRLTSAKGLDSLQSIGGRALFNNLISATGLESLQNIGGDAYFNRLTSAKGLDSLQSIGGDAWFDDLISAKGLDSLQSIGGRALFNNLISATGLGSLQNIGVHARFDNLTSAKGLDSLQSIGGRAEFENLISAAGLDSLQYIGGSARFKKLTSAAGLESLQSIGLDAWFDNLTSAVGLDSLQSIGGAARFKKLTSAAGLESLQSIGLDAEFNNLTSAEGLDSLRSIGGFTKVMNLTSTGEMDIILPMGGDGVTEFKEKLNNRGNMRL